MHYSHHHITDLASRPDAVTPAGNRRASITLHEGDTAETCLPVNFDLVGPGRVDYFIDMYGTTTIPGPGVSRRYRD